MKLLLNGCSFCANYNLAAKLGWRLGMTKFENLAIGGSSNRRIIRSTVRYVLENPVDFVMIGLTFYDRQESPILKNNDPWVSYNANGLQGMFAPNDAEFISGDSRRSVEQHIIDHYRYEINPFYIDQLLCDLLMFSAWLDSQKIRHVIWNTCERHYDTNSPYYNAVMKNQHIVPLTEFISNEFLSRCKAAYHENEEQWPPNARHYDGNEYRHVNEYLLNYIQENKL